MPIEFDGILRYIPDAYEKTKVESSLPGPLPQFHVPILLGAGWAGHPYDVESKLVTGEVDPTPFKLCNTESALADYFGAGTELHRGMKFAKRHGLPFAYVVNLSPLTRASIIADTAGNVEQFTLYPRSFGPIGGWHKIGYATNTLTVVPVKRYAPLVANLATTQTRAYVEGGGIHDWLTVGATVVVGSNTVAGVERTITATGVEITSTGQRRHWVELSAAPASNTNTADYGVILQYATEKTYTKTGLTNAQLFIDYLNELDPYFRAVQHANFSNAAPASIASPTPLKEVTAWGTVTAGTAPAVTNTQLAGFLSLMNAGEWGEFCNREQLIPQTYCLLSSSSTLHGTMRDYAQAERTRGYPISVTVGCAWGDTEIGAGNDTAPEFRAAALNSQDVMLCAGGMDREAAYLSTSPAVWARRVAGGPGHNLTNDSLIFSELEVKWDEINSGELTTLCKKGVATQKLAIGQVIGYVLSQGLTTLQANVQIWNTSDATTHAAMQRDLADAISQTVRRDFVTGFVGADIVDANSIAASLTRRAQRSLQPRGWLKPENGFTITGISLNSSGNGYDVAWSVRLPDTVDFITITTTILVGEA